MLNQIDYLNTFLVQLITRKWLQQNYGVGKDTGQNAVNDGELICEKLAGKYPNVLFVFCGHVLNGGTGRQVSSGKNGNKVYQMLANYQSIVYDSENGGNGYMRMITLNTRDSKISVKTYSPYLNKYKTESDKDFLFESVIF